MIWAKVGFGALAVGRGAGEPVTVPPGSARTIALSYGPKPHIST